MFQFSIFKTKKNKAGNAVYDAAQSHYLLSERRKVLDEQEERAREINVMELSGYIGKPVICVSNENRNPMVGIGKEVVLITQGQCPMLIVEDVVTGEQLMPFGVLFAYTEQKFDALNNMDPQARIALLYYKNSTHVIDKEPTADSVSPDEWSDAVKTALKERESPKRKP